MNAATTNYLNASSALSLGYSDSSILDNSLWSIGARAPGGA